MEVWDAYDYDGNRVDSVSLIRGEPIPDGLYHIACEILVRHTDGTYLIMQRDARKPFGGLWEASVGGSALRGEGPAACAMRELAEETGIVSDALRPIGRTTLVTKQAHVFDFLCVTGMEKQRIVLQEGETVSYRWVTAEQLLSMSAQELVPQRMKQYIAAP